MKVFKRQISHVILILFSIAIVQLSGCKKDDDPNPEQVRLNNLSNTWILGSVTNENNDVTSQFSGFTLTIEQFSFTTQNGGNAWPESGTYSFIENDLNRLLRSDGVEVLIDNISAEGLTLSFQVSTLPGGRTDGVTGNFIFSLQKQ